MRFPLWPIAVECEKWGICVGDDGGILEHVADFKAATEDDGGLNILGRRDAVVGRLVIVLVEHNNRDISCRILRIVFASRAKQHSNNRGRETALSTPFSCTVEL